MRSSSSRIMAAAVIITSLLTLWPRVASATTFTVTVGNGGFFFTPSSATIHTGDTVLWTWSSSGHSSTSGSPGMPSGLWDSGILNQGATFTQTFNNVGSFPYYCTPHGACCNMVGMVTVVSNPTPTPSPAHAPFFTGEVPLANGVYYLQFSNGTPFGYYTYLTDPRFIFHFDMGYEYWFD